MLMKRSWLSAAKVLQHAKQAIPAIEWPCSTTLIQPGAHLQCTSLPVRRSCNCSVAALQSMKPVVAPAPGSVQNYSHHVMLRLPAPAEQGAGGQGGIWWPPLMEKHPALLQAFAAVAEHKANTDGVVKVTAFEEMPGRNSTKNGPKDTVDLLIFPDGVRYQNLGSKQIQQVVGHHIVNPTEDVHQPPLPKFGPNVNVGEFTGVGLFVCTHMQRDTRCGIMGMELATELQRLIQERKLDRLQVFQVSHVGGHKFAGNVLVYGGLTPADGDWFGGVNRENAAEFLTALVDIEMSMDGGAESPVLRKFWRGRMALSKEEQVKLFENPKARLLSEGEDEEDWSDIDLDQDDISALQNSSSSDSSSSSSSDSDQP